MERLMRVLCEEIGVRFGGTGNEHLAAYRLFDEFRSEDVRAQLQRYDFLGWLPKERPIVRVLSPKNWSCTTAPIIYSSSTPGGGVTGRLTWRGYKSLIPGLYDMPCYDIFSATGDLLAQLIVETGGEAIPLLNPRPIYRLPQIVIGAKDHCHLQSLLTSGNEVTVNAEIHTELVPHATSFNVIAQYEGNPNSQERIIINAHYDTQLNTPGCYDNASGVAGLFGLLRKVKKKNLKMNIEFVAVAGEEMGMLGSSYMATDLNERNELKHVKACICLDQISAGETLWIWAGPQSIREKARMSVAKLGPGHLESMKVDNPMPGCDMWPFYIEGIPSCLFMWWRLPDYHKPTDTFERVDMNKVQVCVDAALGLIQSL